MRLPARFPANASPSRRRATCRATRCCSSAPAARASRAPRWPSIAERRASATWCWRRATRAIFSSRVIPGNERSVGRLQNALIGARRRGDHRRGRSTSTSPAIRRATSWCAMYQWVRPQDRPAGPWRAAPHGRACGAGPRTARCRRRCWRPTAPGAAGARAGRDHRPCPCRPAGARRRRALIDLGGDDAARAAQAAVERRRRRRPWSIDGRGGPLAPPTVSLRGIEDADGELSRGHRRRPQGDAGRPQRRPSGATTAGSRRRPARRVRRVVRAHLGKKPLTDVHIVRI